MSLRSTTRREEQVCVSRARSHCRWAARHVVLRELDSVHPLSGRAAVVTAETRQQASSECFALLAFCLQAVNLAGPPVVQVA